MVAPSTVSPSSAPSSPTAIKETAQKIQALLTTSPTIETKEAVACLATALGNTSLDATSFPNVPRTFSDAQEHWKNVANLYSLATAPPTTAVDSSLPPISAPEVIQALSDLHTIHRHFQQRLLDLYVTQQKQQQQQVQTGPMPRTSDQRDHEDETLSSPSSLSSSTPRSPLHENREKSVGPSSTPLSPSRKDVVPSKPDVGAAALSPPTHTNRKESMQERQNRFRQLQLRLEGVRRKRSPTKAVVSPKKEELPATTEHSSNSSTLSAPQSLEDGDDSALYCPTIPTAPAALPEHVLLPSQATSTRAAAPPPPPPPPPPRGGKHQQRRQPWLASAPPPPPRPVQIEIPPPRSSADPKNTDEMDVVLRDALGEGDTSVNLTLDWTVGDEEPGARVERPPLSPQSPHSSRSPSKQSASPRGPRRTSASLRRLHHLSSSSPSRTDSKTASRLPNKNQPPPPPPRSVLDRYRLDRDEASPHGVKVVPRRSLSWGQKQPSGRPQEKQTAKRTNESSKVRPPSLVRRPSSSSVNSASSHNSNNGRRGNSPSRPNMGTTTRPTSSGGGLRTAQRAEARRKSWGSASAPSSPSTSKGVVRRDSWGSLPDTGPSPRRHSGSRPSRTGSHGTLPLPRGASSTGARTPLSALPPMHQQNEHNASTSMATPSLLLSPHMRPRCLVKDQSPVRGSRSNFDASPSASSTPTKQAIPILTTEEYRAAPLVVRSQVTLSQVTAAIHVLNEVAATTVQAGAALPPIPETYLTQLLPSTKKQQSRAILLGLCHFQRMLLVQKPMHKLDTTEYIFGWPQSQRPTPSPAVNDSSSTNDPPFTSPLPTPRS